MTAPNKKAVDEALTQCAGRLMQWTEAKAYGVVEVHFQAGRITHIKEITTHKLESGK